MEELKTGFYRLQVNPERVVCFEGDWHGWLFMRHPDGHLTSIKKLAPWEVMQAEDQRDADIVLDGGHNMKIGSAGRCA